MIHRLALWVVIIAAVFTSSAFGKTAFQVTDSIEMVRIVEPDVALAAFRPPDITLSPDGRHFILVTRRGNVSTGKNEYRLLLYRMAQIEAFLNQENGDLPQAEILYEVATSHNDMPFQKITWLEDGETIAFIGRFDERDKTAFGQVHTLNIKTKALHKMTHHNRPITNFALDFSAQRIIFASTVARNYPDRRKSSYLAGIRNINSIINPDWEYPEPAVRYYIQHPGTPDKPQPVGGIYKGFFPTDISLSPDSRRAIILTTPQELPRQWLENYAFLQDDFSRRALRDFDENTMMRREDLTTAFTIVDMATGEIRPLIDAPTGLWKGGSSIAVRWLPDSRSVILGNVALPTAGVEGGILARTPQKNRMRDFFTVVYDLERGTLTPIARHPAKRRKDESEDEIRGQFYGLGLSAPGQLTIKQKYRGEPLPDIHFKKVRGKWIETPAAPSINENSLGSLQVSIYQDLNNPPELMAQNKKTGPTKIITDFNPQFRNRTLGQVEAISWTAADGRVWRGGLVYPPSYKKDHETEKRYPLVIQTHGFNQGEFLIDGPHGVASAFAAQALANRNIMVLQMAEPRVAQSRAELLAYRQGFESAIDHLAGQGLVDPGKVGLIGWSSTGVDVQHILLTSDYPIAAAVIADSYNIGMLGYINQFGARAPGMAHIENMMGDTVPWGTGLDHWVARNPALHLDRISTPIRYEQYETGLSSWWEVYALLKRQQKPVEYYVFNDATHALIKPRHRLASQSGSLDWFTFWLKGEENPDSTRAAQYDRWARLRSQQEHSKATAAKARKRDAMQHLGSGQEP